ncbi:E3 ubiquitin-protein ligase RNF128-like isoform X2 [Scylla paramamosain]|uniref:E3 ubiquitin-protein ligase RNF128-like isoform X2 n=1 Tax=Scylla paramamosain TaxID=85552 RepID=UPI003083711E
MHSHVFELLALTLTTITTLTSATWTYEGTTVTLALVNYTYRDPRRDGVVVEVGQVGKYAPGQVASASGQVVVGNLAGKSRDLNTVEEGCEFPWTSPSSAPSGTWVALIRRGGGCPDEEKIKIAAANNATAVILYTKDDQAHLRKLAVNKAGLAVVWLGEEEGRSLAQVVAGGAEVVISLVPGHNLRYHVTSVNRESLGQRFVAWNPLCEPRMFPVDCVIVTSVLFVSVSFIILMSISLAWLVFYYVQRFRYIHAKDRLARHLCNAAKKALAKIPVKNLKATDREVSLDGECCAVCIEHYEAGEAVRTLPCKHLFHRCCVDPWLLEHRTCPMCKMDILKHYGYVFSGSTETVLPMEEDEGIEFELRSLSESEESVLQLDLGDGGEGLGGAVGVQGGRDATSHPQGPHTPRAAPHFTPVVMVSRNEGRTRTGSGERQGVMGGETGFTDTPISSIHPSRSSSSPSLSSLATSTKSLSATSVISKLGPSPRQGDIRDGTPPPPPPPAQPEPGSEGRGEEELEVSSVCSAPSPSTPRAPTPVSGGVAVGGAQAKDAVGSDPPAPPQPPPTAPTQPPPPQRPRRRETPKESDSSTASLRPASHVISVSHF